MARAQLWLVHDCGLGAKLVSFFLMRMTTEEGLGGTPGILFVTCGYAVLDSSVVRVSMHAAFCAYCTYPGRWGFVQVEVSVPTVCRALRSQRGTRHLGESGSSL